MLAECLEALSGSLSSNHEHSQHIRYVLLTEQNPGIKAALQLLDERLALHASRNPLDLEESDAESKAFEQQIIDLIGGVQLPRYVYHGTVAGRLRSIHKQGLIPGAVPVWNGNDEQGQLLRSISNQAVFFSPTWRYAQGMWAFITHKTSRSRKTSEKRAPAVIRLNIEGLDVESDPAAVSASWMVKGIVPVQKAEVIIGFDTAFPQWRPLSEVIQETL